MSNSSINRNIRTFCFLKAVAYLPELSARDSSHKFKYLFERAVCNAGCRSAFLKLSLWLTDWKYIVSSRGARLCFSIDLFQNANRKLSLDQLSPNYSL